MLGRPTKLDARLDRVDRRMDKVLAEVKLLRAEQRDLAKEVAKTARRQQRAEKGDIAELRLGVAALQRMVALDHDALPYPQRLTARRFHGDAQREEDGVIVELARQAGITSGRFAELGCGDNGGNSGFAARELGWTGLLVDANPDHVAALDAELQARGVRVREAWVTREDVDALLQREGVSGEIDLLSIDIDGNDLWVLERLSIATPKIIVAEYNTALGPRESVAVPYDADFRRDPRLVEGLWYGASLTAFTRVLARKGYRLVCCENVNGFFLREDVAQHVPAVAPEVAWLSRPSEASALRTVGGDLRAAFGEHGLALVDVD